MTVPVMQILDDTKQEWIVSFSMVKYNEDSLPNPNNNMVFTEVVPPTVTAVIRFNGRANADLLGRKTEELMNWIDELGYVAKEKPRYMFYNDLALTHVFEAQRDDDSCPRIFKHFLAI